MDFHLKQCRNQLESDQQHSANISKFLVQPHQQPPEPTAPDPAPPALPLFVPDSNTKPSTILSAFPDSTSSSSTTLPRMWGFFSVAQRQELELQALIFRYMLAGAAVPPELLQPIKKSLLTSAPFFLHHPLQHYPQYPTSLLQPGYWGRAAMDPEPGRCRRTDGKKWRCSRDVVAGQKYCERHMHRGRNRSRKPVETATTNPTTTASGAGGGCPPLSSSNTNRVAGRPLLSVESGNYFSLSGQSPSIDLLHLNQGGCTDSISENKNFYESHKEASAGDGKSDGHILRHFFDDWPRSDNGGGSDNNVVNQQMNSTSASATSLSISIPGNPSSSDVSLKLSTGGSFDGNGGDRGQVQLNWAAGWTATQMASMGGPLAEALRSANNNSSPTSVLHELQRASTLEASFIST